MGIKGRDVNDALSQVTLHGSPLVDAIIAVHRSDRPVARAVASILEGNMTRVRVIVVAHNIDPQEIKTALGPWALDDRVLLASLQDGIRSPSGPMNHGFDLATAPFTTLLGSDDTLEPGAIDRWVQIAGDAKNPADFVIANRSDTTGATAAIPPVRVGRRVWLDGVRDRLSYRAAPLGLLRRSTFGALRLPKGVYAGGDIELSAHIWFSGANIAFAYGKPGYLVHSDQEDRVTTTARPIDDDFRWVGPVLAESQPWMRNADQRRAVIVKILRKNVIDAVKKRVSIPWSEENSGQMKTLLKTLYAAEPTAFHYLSRGEAALIRALMKGGADSTGLQRLLRGATGLRSLDAVVPVIVRNLLSAQGPLRYHIAGFVLAREARGE